MRSTLSTRFLFSSGAFAVLALLACSSSSNSTGSGSGSGSSSGSSGSPNCQDSNAFQITFSPMYSAYEVGSSNPFYVPAVTNFNSSDLAWFASANATITYENATEQAEGLGDVWISPTGGGDGGVITITAEAKTDGGLTGLCATTTLTVDECTADQLDAGKMRYYYGTVISQGDAGCDAFGEFLSEADEPDGGPFSGAKCVNCHGATAALDFGPVSISAVEHTPEQTGGFSDEALTNIIQHGTMPDSGYFTSLSSDNSYSGLTYPQWQQFHHWTFDSDYQFSGILCYLRSLTPVAQSGSADFGGHGPRGGGDGGGFMGPPPDGGGRQGCFGGGGGPGGPGGGDGG